MENKIKRILSLEELGKLKEGTRVNVFNVLNGQGLEHVYEGFEQKENGGVYSFLSFNKRFTQDRIMTSWKVKEEDISFNPHSFISLKIKSYSFETYRPMEKSHKEKLKIIQGGNK
jgi:hypothetical protein